MDSIEVIKVQNTQIDNQFKIPNHGRSPRLYLELIENKDRVKQTMINKEYVPPQPKFTSANNNSIENAASSKPTDQPKTKELITDNHKDDDNDEISLDDIEDEDSTYKQDTSNVEEDQDVEVHEENNSHEQYQEVAQEDIKQPPSLSEIGAGKKYYRDISNVTKDEVDIDNEKRELLFKFDMLKRQYKDCLASVSIPEFHMSSDLQFMQKTYDTLLRRVMLDSTVDDYKNYFQKGCFALEFALNYLGFDINGFTADQMTKMNTYERLLVELCAKHYNPNGSSIPVELRLLGIILLNAAMFIGMKIMAKKFESSSGSSIPQMNPFNNATTSEPQKRMRGPQNIDLEKSI